MIDKMLGFKEKPVTYPRVKQMGCEEGKACRHKNSYAKGTRELDDWEARQDEAAREQAAQWWAE